MNRNYLSELINSGADAFSNLFTVTLRSSDNSNLLNTVSSTRIEMFTAPEKSVATTTLSYQNTFINITLPSNSSVSKRSTFRFRIDENYDLYNTLKKQIPLENFSNFTIQNFFEPAELSIIVEAFKSSNTSTPVYRWTFNRCKLVSVSDVSYEYNNTNTISVNVEFIWEDLEEELLQVS